MAPVSMSAKTIRHFLEMDVQLLPPVSLSRNGQIWDRKKGFVKAYTSEHMLGMLRAGQHVVDRQKLTANLKNAVAFLKPHVDQLPEERKIGQLVAHKSTQCRNIVRLDMASMLWNRKSYKPGSSYRYLAYDASPQCGHEYFVSVERVVEREAMNVSMASGCLPAVASRLLPLSVLGCCRMGLAENCKPTFTRLGWNTGQRSVTFARPIWMFGNVCRTWVASWALQKRAT